MNGTVNSEFMEHGAAMVVLQAKARQRNGADAAKISRYLSLASSGSYTACNDFSRHHRYPIHIHPPSPHASLMIPYFSDSTASSIVRSSTALHQSFHNVQTASVVTGVVTSPSLFQLILTFVAGGFFFSTVLAFIAAVYAVGLDNARRGWDLFKLIVRQIWITFTVGLIDARTELLRSDEDTEDAIGKSGPTKRKRFSWKWRSAWKVLKQNLVLTRKKATEGIEAVKMEATMYAAIVGAPGLIPLQYVIDRLHPFSIAAQLETSLRESLATFRDKNVQKVKLVSFTAGTIPPKLQAARVFDLGSQAMALDCTLDWTSDLAMTLLVFVGGGLARFPVTIQNVQFKGAVRLVFTPLIKHPPGYGAMLVSLSKAPLINLDLRVAGGLVTKVPWLRSELVGAIQKGITNEFLWPNRAVIPTMTPNGKPLLSKNELEALATMDPLLQAERDLEEEQVLNDILRQRLESTRLSAQIMQKQTKIYVNRRELNKQTTYFEDEGHDGTNLSHSKFRLLRAVQAVLKKFQ